jgi:hypothetical protein
MCDLEIVLIFAKIAYMFSLDSPSCGRKKRGRGDIPLFGPPTFDELLCISLSEASYTA